MLARVLRRRDGGWASRELAGVHHAMVAVETRLVFVAPPRLGELARRVDEFVVGSPASVIIVV
jgi:hypothetical protein